MREAQIVRDVLDAYAQWGLGDAVAGEWGAIRAGPRQTLHAALKDGDEARLAEILFHPIGRGEWSGMFTPIACTCGVPNCEHLPGYLQQEMAMRRNILALANQPAREIDPFPDTIRHDAEAALLVAKGHRIVEIGGGYGGMALALYHRVPALRYVDIDLADTLYLAYGYLASHLPEGAVALGFHTFAPISLVPSHAIPDLHPCDTVCNYRSWSEMGAQAVGAYFHRIQEWAPRWVVHENVGRLDTYRPGDTGLDYPEVPVSAFPVLPGYVCRRDTPSPWLLGGARYVRQEWERVDAQ